MKKVILVSVLALASTAVFAQLPTVPGAGPSIVGGVQMNIQAAENINAAVGNESSASQSLGAIESGNIKGDTEMTIVSDQNMNAAVGNKSCTDQQIGTIGKASACK